MRILFPYRCGFMVARCCDSRKELKEYNELFGDIDREKALLPLAKVQYGFIVRAFRL